jgi:phosphatidylserine decarboxylase
MRPLGVSLQHVLPHGLMARVVHAAAHSRKRWIKRPLIRWFAANYGIDLREAAQDDLDAYDSFNEFFTRALKPGARPAAGDAGVVVSPVDGRLTEHGTLRKGRLIQAKGLSYALADLVGEGPVDAHRFENGAYATIYLAPHDYHRVHMPLAGRLTAVRYVPGRRFSVNEATSCGIRNLFCRNERVVCWFEMDAADARGMGSAAAAAAPAPAPVPPPAPAPTHSMALVLVGALNVSSISLADRGEIPSGTARYTIEPAPKRYEKGAEIGRFNLGSTVVVLFPEGAVEWEPGIEPGRKLRVGEAIGRRMLRAADAAARPAEAADPAEAGDPAEAADAAEATGAAGEPGASGPGDGSAGSV